MQLRKWTIAVAIVGVIAFALSGVLKNDNSGFLGALSAAAWIIFLVCILAEAVIGTVALLRQLRKEGTAQKA